MLQKTRLRHRGFVTVVSLSCAALVLCLLSAGCQVAPENARRPPLNAEEQRGKRVYDARCVSCHDPYSEKPRQGPGLAGMFQKKYLTSGLPATDEHARDAILMGRGNMPGFRAALDDQEVNDLVVYLHTL